MRIVDNSLKTISTSQNPENGLNKASMITIAAAAVLPNAAACENFNTNMRHSNTIAIGANTSHAPSDLTRVVLNREHGVNATHLAFNDPRYDENSLKPRDNCINFDNVNFNAYDEFVGSSELTDSDIKNFGDELAKKLRLSSYVKNGNSDSSLTSASGTGSAAILSRLPPGLSDVEVFARCTQLVKDLIIKLDYNYGRVVREEGRPDCLLIDKILDPVSVYAPVNTTGVISNGVLNSKLSLQLLHALLDSLHRGDIDFQIDKDFDVFMRASNDDYPRLLDASKDFANSRIQWKQSGEFSPADLSADLLTLLDLSYNSYNRTNGKHGTIYKIMRVKAVEDLCSLSTTMLGKKFFDNCLPTLVKKRFPVNQAKLKAFDSTTGPVLNFDENFKKFYKRVVTDSPYISYLYPATHLTFPMKEARTTAMKEAAILNHTVRSNYLMTKTGFDCLLKFINSLTHNRISLLKLIESNALKATNSDGTAKLSGSTSLEKLFSAAIEASLKASGLNGKDEKDKKIDANELLRFLSFHMMKRVLDGTAGQASKLVEGYKEAATRIRDAAFNSILCRFFASFNDHYVNFGSHNISHMFNVFAMRTELHPISRAMLKEAPTDQQKHAIANSYFVPSFINNGSIAEPKLTLERDFSNKIALDPTAFSGDVSSDNRAALENAPVWGRMVLDHENHLAEVFEPCGTEIGMKRIANSCAQYFFGCNWSNLSSTNKYSLGRFMQHIYKPANFTHVGRYVSNNPTNYSSSSDSTHLPPASESSVPTGFNSEQLNSLFNGGHSESDSVDSRVSNLLQSHASEYLNSNVAILLSLSRPAEVSVTNLTE